MICGHCKGANADTEHVRACSKGETFAAAGAPQWKVNDDVSTWTDESGATAVRTPVTEPGIYRLNDTIYKVQVAVHGSGRLYAKRLVIERDYLATGEGVTATFEYAPGTIRDLAAEDRLTVEEAKCYGALYGTCIVCGRTLTDENSIAAGIGPVCANKV